MSKFHISGGKVPSMVKVSFLRGVRCHLLSKFHFSGGKVPSIVKVSFIRGVRCHLSSKFNLSEGLGAIYRQGLISQRGEGPSVV